MGKEISSFGACLEETGVFPLFPIQNPKLSTLSG